MSPSAHRGKAWGIGVIATVIVTMIGVGLVLGPAAGEGTLDTTTPTSRPTRLLIDSVRRDDLVASKEAVGNVGHGTAWSAPTEVQGIVTNRHDRGTVVASGEPLIWIDDKPVLLVAGAKPMYRTLHLQGSTASKHLKGDDVSQLQEFLLSKGFNDRERLKADGVFGASTRRTVKAWQKENGWDQSGELDRTQLVFHPTSVRIENAPQLGSVFADLQLTDATQKVTVEFDDKSRPFVPIGATVAVEFDGTTIDGTVRDVASAVSDSGSSVLKVTVEPSMPLPAEVERVKIIATRTLATDVLVVPVRAVLALAGGGYALEVMTSSGVELRAVELGALVDDLVEVSGNFSEGDEVVVANDRFGDSE